MKKMKKKSGGGGANWIDTYADMVTLLMCFFVMMFSMSSVSEEKFQALAESFNPDATIEGFSEVVDDPDVTQGAAEMPSEEQIEMDMQQLYEEIVEYTQAAGIERQVSVSLGDGYVFISFQDAVFFAPDSSILSDEGEEVLDAIALSIGQITSSIDVIEVLGHTAQAVSNTPNQVTADRYLASDRATRITIYLQEKDIVEPARLISVGYGQWRPLTGNANEEERVQNRRVELVISGFNPEGTPEDTLQEYYDMVEGSVSNLEEITGEQTEDAQNESTEGEQTEDAQAEGAQSAGEE